jgi:hypothetical protein
MKVKMILNNKIQNKRSINYQLSIWNNILNYLIQVIKKKMNKYKMSSTFKISMKKKIKIKILNKIYFLAILRIV